MMYDLLAKFNGGQTIQRIRAIGKLPNNSEAIIDTSFIIKKNILMPNGTKIQENIIQIICSLN